MEIEKRLKIQHAAVLCFAVYALILVWQCAEKTSTALSVSILIVIFAVTAGILMTGTGTKDTANGKNGADGDVAAYEKREHAVHVGEMALVWLCILLFFAYGIYYVFIAGVM
ncbi:hypothetical protein [Methanomicrobium mobile]|uniref:hypothetical protein n=1 Tax=Methanomicrobium mobile TaxID=2205 RepID=UPI0005B25A2E|nr:hypothetical protein [Methanomicrobium mobile]